MLLARLRTGSADAFTQLYFAYCEQMYGNIFKMVKDKQVAEEIVQDIFTQVWQKRDTLQFNQGFAGYLYRMGQNRVCDFYRKLQRDRQLLEKFKVTVIERYEPIEEALYYRESNALLLQALESLSPQQKKVYSLCKIEGWSYKQAARQLGISPFTVKEYLSTASKAVRNYLNNHFDTALGSTLLIMILQFL